MVGLAIMVGLHHNRAGGPLELSWWPITARFGRHVNTQQSPGRRAMGNPPNLSQVLIPGQDMKLADSKEHRKATCIPCWGTPPEQLLALD